VGEQRPDAPSLISRALLLKASARAAEGEQKRASKASIHLTSESGVPEPTASRFTDWMGKARRSAPPQALSAIQPARWLQQHVDPPKLEREGAHTQKISTIFSRGTAPYRKNTIPRCLYQGLCIHSCATASRRGPQGSRLNTLVVWSPSASRSSLVASGTAADRS